MRWHRRETKYADVLTPSHTRATHALKHNEGHQVNSLLPIGPVASSTRSPPTLVHVPQTFRVSRPSSSCSLLLLVNHQVFFSDQVCGCCTEVVVALVKVQSVGIDLLRMFAAAAPRSWRLALLSGRSCTTLQPVCLTLWRVRAVWFRLVVCLHAHGSFCSFVFHHHLGDALRSCSGHHVYRAELHWHRALQVLFSSHISATESCVGVFNKDSRKLVSVEAVRPEAESADVLMCAASLRILESEADYFPPCTVQHPCSGVAAVLERYSVALSPFGDVLVQVASSAELLLRALARCALAWSVPPMASGVTGSMCGARRCFVLR